METLLFFFFSQLIFPPSVRSYMYGYSPIVEYNVSTLVGGGVSLPAHIVVSCRNSQNRRLGDPGGRAELELRQAEDFVRPQRIQVEYSHMRYRCRASIGDRIFQEHPYLSEPDPAEFEEEERLYVKFSPKLIVTSTTAKTTSTAELIISKRVALDYRECGNIGHRLDPVTLITTFSIFLNFVISSG